MRHCWLALAVLMFVGCPESPPPSGGDGGDARTGDFTGRGDLLVVCGDGRCEGEEDRISCPADCPIVCGDDLCEGPEDRSNCALDCAVCGDAICEGRESRYSCMFDCMDRSGLIGFWSFDTAHRDEAQQQVRDLTANQNHAVYQGGVSFEPSPRGEAIRFDGSDGAQALIADAQNKLSGMASYTIAFWALKRSTAQNQQLLSRGGVFGTQSVWAPKDAPVLQAFMRNKSSIRDPLPPPVAIPLGTYFHYALTYNGTTCRQYVNGLVVKHYLNGQLVPVAGCATGGLLSDPTVPLVLSGASPTQNVHGFDGSLDDLMIFDRALSDQEVSYISHQGIQQTACDDGRCDRYFDSPWQCPNDCLEADVAATLVSGNDYTVWYASPAVKIRPFFTPPPASRPRALLRLARNERRVLQLAIRASRALKLTVQAQAKPAFAVTLLAEGTVPIAQMSQHNFSARGLFYDPLQKIGEPLAIDAGKTAVLLVEVQPLASAKPGLTADAIRVEIGASVVPIDVQLYDFALPDETTLKTAFDSGHFDSHIQEVPGCLARSVCGFHGLPDTAARALADVYYDDYARHRIAPYTASLYRPVRSAFNCATLTFDFSALDPIWKHYLDDLHLSALMVENYWSWYFENGFRLCGKELQKDADYEALAIAYYKGLAAHFAARGWTDKAYFSFDEPAGQVATTMAQTITRIITEHTSFRVGPALDRATTFDLLKDGTNQWIVLANVYEQTPRAKIDALRARGDSIWWYYTSGPQFDIDGTAVDNIAFLWSAWKHDIAGILTWAGLIFDSHCKTTPYNKMTDPYVDPQGIWGAGQVTFYYPPCAGVCAPPSYGLVPSLRWKLFREGIQDYEYFTLLSKAIARAKARGLATLTAEQALDRVGELVTGPRRWQQDPNLVLQIRRGVAEAIESLP